MAVPSPLSVKDRPVGSVPALAKAARGFPVDVTVNVPLAPTVKVVALALVMAGATAGVTVSDAFDVLPAPASVSDTVTLLFLMPAVVAVTETENVQFDDAPRVAPASAIDEAPAVAVMVPPPQEPTMPLGVATTKPAGRVSLKLTLLSPTVVLGLLSVKVRVVEALLTMLAAPKAAAILGGVT